MSELLKAARAALPGLEWDGDDCEVGADIPDMGVATLWRAPSSMQAQLSMFTASTMPMPPVDAAEWIRAQVTARRDALDAALGEVPRAQLSEALRLADEQVYEPAPCEGCSCRGHSQC